MSDQSHSLSPFSDLDIEQLDTLIAYLHATDRIGSAERPRAQRLSGGVSNRTVLVERDAGPDLVLKQALAKLRVAVDWFSDPVRIHREALGLRHLERLAPPGTITPFVFEDREHHILAMRAVPQPHDNLKMLLLTATPSAEVMLDYARQFGLLLGAIHGRSNAERRELSTLFDDRSFFESLRLEPYYLYSATIEPRAAPFLRDLVETTRQRRLALVHGDYSPKNVLVYRGNLILLDHEVIHWGDPAFDLGFALSHLLSKARHRSNRSADFVGMAHEFWAAYRQSLGTAPWEADLEPWAVRHTLACLLARVVGRSPLEYLDSAARERQRLAVLRVLGVAEGGLEPRPPLRLSELCERMITES